jgi:hypothetical protein
MTIDCASGHVTVRYTNDHGEEKVEDERMDLPADLANGVLTTLVKNVRPDAVPASLSLLVATPKPRVVRLKPSIGGTDRFLIGGSTRSAVHYVLKVEIGGVAGLVAPLVGKQPPDAHVWIMGGEAPAFVRSEAPMFMGDRCGAPSSPAPCGRRDREPRPRRQPMLNFKRWKVSLATAIVAWSNCRRTASSSAGTIASYS